MPRQEHSTAMGHYFVTYALFLREVFLQQVLNFVTLFVNIMFSYRFVFSYDFFSLKKLFFIIWIYFLNFLLHFINSGAFKKSLKNLDKIKTTCVCMTQSVTLPFFLNFFPIKMLHYGYMHTKNIFFLQFVVYIEIYGWLKFIFQSNFFLICKLTVISFINVTVVTLQALARHHFLGMGS